MRKYDKEFQEEAVKSVHLMIVIGQTHSSRQSALKFQSGFLLCDFV